MSRGIPEFVDIAITGATTQEEGFFHNQAEVHYALSSAPNHTWRDVFNRVYAQQPPTAASTPYASGAVITLKLPVEHATPAVLDQIKANLEAAIQMANREAKAENQRQREGAEVVARRQREQRAGVQAILDRQFPQPPRG